MPIYRYKCVDCGYMDDYIRHMDQADLTPLCRFCNGQSDRIINFQGTVWSPTSGGHK